jgi:hypothetical protein
LVTFLNLLQSVANGSSHFVAVLFCSEEQQSQIQLYCNAKDSFFRSDNMFFERHTNTAFLGHRLGNDLEFGVVLHGKQIIMENYNMGLHPKKVFSKHKFGKWPKGTDAFHFKKSPRVIRFLLQRYAFFDDARVVDLFAGSLSALRAALSFRISMDFVEKDSRQINLWPHQVQVHLRHFSDVKMDDENRQSMSSDRFIDNEAIEDRVDPENENDSDTSESEHGT